MPKIILTAVNAKYSHSNPALYYLKKAIDSLNTAECIMIDWDINRPVRGLLETLAASEGSHFFFSAYIWNSSLLKQVIPDLAVLLPEAVIGAGGPEAVFKSREWLEIPGIDYIFDGNAENFAPMLAGLGKAVKPEVLKASPRPFRETAFPYTEEDLKSLKDRIIYYEASRGCIFNCSYCLSASGPGVESRTAQQVKEELSILSRFEGTVKFVDRTFNADPEISRLVWRLMIGNPPAGCFHFELHPALLSDEDFILLEALPSGSAQFEIGIQSTDPAVLRKVNRSGNWEKSKAAIKRLTATGKFHIHLDQIVGLPGASAETTVESLDEILSLQPDMFQLGFLKLLPGSPLAAAAEGFGIKASSAPPYEVLETADLSFTEIQHFHRIELLIKRLYNSEFFRASLPFLSRHSGGWYRLLTSLLKTLPPSPGECEIPELNNNRWEFWGRQLLAYCEKEHPCLLLQLTDLLRLDWCPFAGAQHYPDCIEYDDPKKMNSLKTEACRSIRLKHPELKKSSLKRSILYIPAYCGSSDQKGDNILFVRDGGKLLKFRV